MTQTSSRWHYYEEEDLHFALIQDELYQCLSRNDGGLRPEFWRVDWAQLDEHDTDRFAEIAKRLEPLSYTNQRWYPYEEDGSFYQLEGGVLRQCPMNMDGTRDDSPCEVDWGCVEPNDRLRLREIVKELRQRI